MGIIGRPKTQNPKDSVGSIRITQAEKRHLTLTYGSVSKGLRHALDQLMGTTASVRTEPADAGVMVGGADETKPRDGGFAAVGKRHVHKPESLVSEFADKGTLMQEWKCSCGHLMTRRAA